jgi:hypothetical protein
MAACALTHLHVVVYKLVGEGNIGYPEELVSVGSFEKMMEERTTSIWKGTYTLSE